MLKVPEVVRPLGVGRGGAKELPPGRQAQVQQEQAVLGPVAVGTQAQVLGLDVPVHVPVPVSGGGCSGGSGSANQGLNQAQLRLERMQYDDGSTLEDAGHVEASLCMLHAACTPKHIHDRLQSSQTARVVGHWHQCPAMVASTFHDSMTPPASERQPS